MTPNEGLLALESYRLAQHSALLPCYICEENNTTEAELCVRCFAPMALAHQAQSQRTQPRMLATIGTSGVGKTVYLGMLMDMLSRQPERLQLLARGAFSISLQQQTAEALARRQFPEKTPSEPDRWNWVHCQVSGTAKKRPVELVMPDMAGEALLEEIEHPHAYPVVRALLSKCQGVLVLLDAMKLHGGKFDQDYFAMKLVSYLLELDSHPKTGWARRPMAIVFTKADECEDCFDDPVAYAATHAAGLNRLCEKQLHNYKYFASGVVGGCADRVTRGGRLRVPLRIEPRGLVQPFEWLIGQLK